MSVTVTQRPAAWAGAFNPVVYKLQRKDYTFNSIDSNAGAIRVNFTGVDIHSSFAAGDLVDVYSLNGVYADTYTVAGSVFSGGDTKVTMVEAYTAAAASGYVNLQTRKNYRLSVYLYKASDDTLLIEDAIEYTPDAIGLITVDVQIIQALLAPDSAAYTGSIVEEDDTRLLQFYIKYREDWTGSAESITSDVANPGRVLYGAVQIGSSNDLSDYVLDNSTSKFLTLFDEPTIVEGEKFDISLIPAMSNELVRVKRYTGATLDSTTDTSVGSHANKLIRFPISRVGSEDRITAEVIADNSLPALNDGAWANFGAGTSWSVSATPAVSLGPTSSSKYYRLTPFAGAVGSVVSIDYSITTNKASGGYLLEWDLVLLDEAGAVTDYVGNVVSSSNGTYTGTLTVTATAPFRYLAFICFTDDTFAVGTVTTTVNSLAVHAGTSIDYTVSEVKTIRALDTKPNPITLAWVNSVGGLEWFTFQVNQEQTYDSTGGKKAKKLTLYADDLTLNQWETIQGLNTLGDTYMPAIPEMTTSLNKTTRRLGQQVYVVSQIGTFTGVIVVPSADKTATMWSRHFAKITIIYPYQFLQS